MKPQPVSPQRRTTFRQLSMNKSSSGRAQESIWEASAAQRTKQNKTPENNYTTKVGWTVTFCLQAAGQHYSKARRHSSVQESSPHWEKEDRFARHCLKDPLQFQRPAYLRHLKTLGTRKRARLLVSAMKEWPWVPVDCFRENSSSLCHWWPQLLDTMDTVAPTYTQLSSLRTPSWTPADCSIEDPSRWNPHSGICCWGNQWPVRLSQPPPPQTPCKYPRKILRQEERIYKMPRKQLTNCSSKAFPINSNLKCE